VRGREEERGARSFLIRNQRYFVVCDMYPSPTAKMKEESQYDCAKATKLNANVMLHTALAAELLVVNPFGYAYVYDRMKLVQKRTIQFWIVQSVSTS
jgi:hypothetical protein